MKLNQELFNKKLVQHKQSIIKLARKHPEKPSPEDQDDYLFDECKRQGKSLSLIYSQFKCQKCSTEERLSWHHLIQRNVKNFMPFDRYVASRHYWNNIIILCWKCHKEIHGVEDKGKLKNETEISKDLINKLKKKYYGEEYKNGV